MCLHWGFIVLIRFSSIIEYIALYEFIENTLYENYFTNEIFVTKNFVMIKMGILIAKR